jgi:magnesium transporter
MQIRKGKINWVHLMRPSDRELEALRKEFDIHPIIIDELKEASARSKVEVHDGYLFAVLHLPVYDLDERVSRRGEIDFIVTKKTVITVQYEDLEPIDLIGKKIEESKEYQQRLLESSAARLMYYLIESCLLFTLRQLRHVDEKIEYIRNTIFNNHEKDLLEKISYVKRDLLSYRLIIKSQAALFTSLQRHGSAFFGKDSDVLFADLEGDYLKIERQAENYKETVEAFENTNTQLLTLRMTKVVQRFSVLAFLTFPIMVFLALLTVEAESRPALGFWTIAGIVIAAVATMVIVFRKKDWL